jgi:hypothetical protein
MKNSALKSLAGIRRGKIILIQSNVPENLLFLAYRIRALLSWSGLETFALSARNEIIFSALGLANFYCTCARRLSADFVAKVSCCDRRAVIPSL